MSEREAQGRMGRQETTVRKTIEAMLTDAVRRGGKAADEKIKEKLDELSSVAKTPRTRAFWKEIRSVMYGDAQKDDEE